ncbi:hypothetical protein [Lacticaseibacillus daqingensis]|uniref:hypothetical protein n=1 Tax=Lacticaseibacillus daqingensis TaxID=2486014 RepID=UPI000F79A4B0|nr:hypothetical protein [Lacticaseibacillus daqingensis]
MKKEKRLFTAVALMSALVGSLANIVLIQTPLGALAELICVLLCTGALILRNNGAIQLGIVGRIATRLAVLLTLAGVLALTQETSVSTFGEVRGREMLFSDAFRMRVRGKTYAVTYTTVSWLSWRGSYNLYVRQYGFYKRVNPTVIVIYANHPNVDPIQVFKKTARTGRAEIDGQAFVADRAGFFPR